MTTDIYQEAMDALVLAEGNKAQAARDLEVPVSTYKDRLSTAETLGITPSVMTPDTATAVAEIKLKTSLVIKQLKLENKALTHANITSEAIRKVAFELAAHSPKPPAWIAEDHVEGSAGIPTLMLSDFHWGESIDQESIRGINDYSLKIARTRLRTTVEAAIDICENHITNSSNEGLILVLGGDMVSGDIHEELAESNEAGPIPAVLDVFEHLIAAIDRLLSVFGKIFIPCAYGNHGRNTKGYRFKGAAESNFDWMLYNLLEKHYKSIGETSIQFLIPNGFDTVYSVLGHKYLLTHGDRLGVRGGGGIVGMIGPIMRGAQKVTSQHKAVGSSIDTIIMGHFHQYLHLKNIVVNGSLKGYDEYAAGCRFDPEPPTQALWFTHPDRGITIKTPIYSDPVNKSEKKAWVSVLT